MCSLGLAGSDGGLDFDRSVAPRVEERLGDLWVELGAGAARDLAQRVVDRQSRTVRTRRRHRVKGVRDGQDATLEGNLSPGTARRVAGAVPALVVEEHIRQSRRQRTNT